MYKCKAELKRKYHLARDVTCCLEKNKHILLDTSSSRDCMQHAPLYEIVGRVDATSAALLTPLVLLAFVPHNPVPETRR